MELNGAAIKEIRTRSGLSVSSAAAKAGVTQPTWTRWERGQRQASPENVQAICEVLAIKDMTAILAGPAKAAS